MFYRTVCRWIVKFKSGQQQVKDVAHTGHPALTTTKSNIKKSAIPYKKLMDSQGGN